MTSKNDAGTLVLGHSYPRVQKQSIGFSPHLALRPPSGLEQPVLHALDDGPLIVCGRTGSGKSTTSLIPICLEAPPDVTLIVVDCKSEVSAVTAAHRERLGAQVHRLDPWRIGTNRPSRLNPLDLIGDPHSSASAADDAATIAEALIVDWGGGHDGFWDASARSAVQMGTLLLSGHAPPEARNLGALGDMLGGGVGPTLTGFLAAGLCCDLGDGMVRREAGNLVGLAAPTLSSITAHLATHLRPLSSPQVKESFSGSEIDLAALTSGEPVTIYLTVPAEKLRSHRALLRVWLNTLVAALARRRRKPTSRTIILVDEVAQLGHMEAIPTIAFLLRGYGVSLALYCQAIDQLQRLYPSDWRALIDNAGTMVSLSGGGGMRRLIEIAAGHDAARHADEIGADEAAVIRNGAVEIIRKADYRLDPRHAHLATLNPYFSDTGVANDR